MYLLFNQTFHPGRSSEASRLCCELASEVLGHGGGSSDRSSLGLLAHWPSLLLSWPGSKVGVFFKGDAGVITTVELKRCVASTRILGVIISEFRHWQKSSPIVLLPIDKGSKVGFYGAILPLSLAVGLGVRSGRETSLDTQEITQRGPKLRREGRSSVIDDRIGKTVVPDYNVDNYLRKTRSIDGDLYRLVVDHLYESVNNEKYQVIAVALPVGRHWQPSNKIHGEIFPSVCRNW